MENVKLDFSEEALLEIAKKALERKTGARGLRSIMESILLDPMYDMPGRTDVETVAISGDVVKGKAKPDYVQGDGKPKAETAKDEKAEGKSAAKLGTAAV